MNTDLKSRLTRDPGDPDVQSPFPATSGFAPAPQIATVPAPTSTVFPILLKILAIVIATVSTTVAVFPPALISMLLKILGGSLVLLLAHQLSKRFVMPGEVKLYYSFLLWGALCSVIVAVDIPSSMQMAWKILQAGFLFWAVVLAHQRHPDLRITMVGIWLIGILYIYVAHSNQAIAMIDETGGRMTVMGENSNTGGQVFVFAIMAALYLSERAASWRTKIPLIGSIPLLVFFLLFTGSRKMLIGAVIIATLWTLTMGKGKNPLAQVLLAMAIAATAYVVVLLWAETPMGQRYAYAEKDMEGRSSLYSDGWTLIQEHPAGIGFANQRHYMRIGEVHTEFLDVLLTTGFVGAAIYFSIYLLALRRIARIRGAGAGIWMHDRRFFGIYMVLIFWLMFGYSRFKDPLHMVVFGSFVGVFFRMQKDRAAIRRRAVSQSGGAGFSPLRGFNPKNVFQ